MIRARASKANTQKWYNSTSALLNNVLPALYHDFAKQRYYDTALGETALPYTATIRSSNAMQFDANGNLVWAPANMVINSEMSGASVPSTQPTNWSMVNSAGCTWAVAAVGSDTFGNYVDFRLTGTAGGATEFPSLQLANSASSPAAINGQRWTISAYIVRTAPTPAGGSGLNLIGRDGGGSGVAGQGITIPVPASAALTRYSDNFTFSSASVVKAQARYLITVSAGQAVDETIRIYKPQLELWGPDSPKNYVPSTTAAAYYGPRYDYDPVTRAPLGVLVEEQRTNDIVNSFMLNSGVGTFQDGVGSNGPTYLGGWPSARYTGDGVSTPHFYFSGSVTPAASTSRSVSAIVGYVDTQFLQLATSANWALDAANTYMNIDAIAGTITASGSAVTNPYILKLGNNVYQIGFTCVSSAVPTGGAGAIVGAANSGTAGRLPTFTHTGSFDVIYLSNCAGTGWESITPSYETASTRAQDNYRMTTGSWLNTSRGTVYAEARKVTVVGGAYTFSNIGNDSGSSERNQFRISSTNTSHIITVTGVVQATTSTGTAVPVGNNFKAAYRYAIGAQNLFEDGSVGTAGNIAALPAVQDTLHTGELGSASEKFNGWIKEVRYYNTASASNAQIQAITT